MLLIEANLTSGTDPIAARRGGARNIQRGGTGREGPAPSPPLLAFALFAIQRPHHFADVRQLGPELRPLSALVGVTRRARLALSRARAG